MTDDIANRFIVLNKKRCEAILKAYHKAKKNGEASFTIYGVELLTSYAKYFLMHWCPKLGVEFKEEENDKQD